MGCAAMKAASEPRNYSILIADDLKMTKEDLHRWVEKAHCALISEYTVPWVTAESRHGWDLAREWIDQATAKRRPV